jgi:hypothetical protein
VSPTCEQASPTLADTTTNSSPTSIGCSIATEIRSAMDRATLGATGVRQEHHKLVPPHRATTSSGRPAADIRAAAVTRTLSPASWPMSPIAGSTTVL